MITLIEVKAKCHHLKKITCKWTLRQVFIRVYKLEITRSVMLVFSTQLCDLYSPLVPLSPSLKFNSLPPLPCVNKYTVHVTVCRGWGGYGVLGIRKINTRRKVPIQVIFFSWHLTFCLPSIILIFLRISRRILPENLKKNCKRLIPKSH